MPTYNVVVETEQGKFAIDVDASEGTPDREIQAKAIAELNQHLGWPALKPEQAAVEGLAPTSAPDMRFSVPPESTGPFSAAAHAFGGEASALLRGGRKLAARLTGDIRSQQVADRVSQALERAQAARTEGNPIAAMAGGMAPYLLTPQAWVSSLPRAAATGGATGLVRGGGSPGETAVGALGGTAGYGLGRILARPPSQLNPFQQRALEQGGKIGIHPTPAQTTGGRAMNILESSLESNFLTQGATARMVDRFQRVSNKAAAEAVGETGGEIDDLVIGDARRRIGKVFDEIGGKVTARVDDTFLDDLIFAQDELLGSIIEPDSEKLLKKVHERIFDEIEDETISGARLAHWRSTLDKRVRSRGRGIDPDPDLTHALRRTATALDDLLLRNADPEDVPRLMEARTQWRNVLFLEKPGVVRAGNLSPRTLANVLAREAPDEYRRGARQGTASPTDRLFAVARFGQAFPPQPSSGSAQRLSVPTAGSAIGGGAMATGDLFSGMALGLGAPALLSNLYRRYPLTTGVLGLPASAGPVTGGVGARLGTGGALQGMGGL